MIGPQRLSWVSAEAVVPEQVVAYVCAVTGSQPKMIGACIGYESESALVLVGYPLHDPRDAGAMAAAVEQALKTPGLRRLTVIGPARPPQAPAGIQALEDAYFALPVPAPPPAQKLRNMLRRAGRELRVDRGRNFEDDHLRLVQRYLDRRHLDGGTRHIFRRLPHFIHTSEESLIVSARFADGGLAAFAVGEFASLSTSFFMFCFRDLDRALPGSADLVLSGLLEEAQARGQTRMNLGLGVNAGIRFFKRKWGADAFLPYVETSWNREPRTVFTRLGGILRRSSPW